MNRLDDPPVSLQLRISCEGSSAKSDGSCKWSKQGVNLLLQRESLLQVGKEDWSSMLHTLTKKNILLFISGLDSSLLLGLSF